LRVCGVYGVDLDKALSSCWPAGRADVHGTSVQDQRETRRALNHRSLGKLRDCSPDSWRRPVTGALDCTRRRAAVSARQL